jgi:NADH dehydrogenase (ubiquinone) Fe-S protein 1
MRGGVGGAASLLRRARALQSFPSFASGGGRAFGASAPARKAAQPAEAEDTAVVYVDGNEVEVQSGVTVMQACQQAGVDIPRFCYHQRLSIAGNCRMCLVEVEKAPKPVASCAAPIRPGMSIKTTTPQVKKAREGVMEFLLANHPLDCPICDQGGECDLQDQAMNYGSDRGRFGEWKRGVEDKDLGPLVKTVMTRCIQCTRCVRFASEVAGVEDLGMLGRGNQSEIGTYVQKLMTSELSGNVIDLCPVGALTNKPYAFKARPWELKSTETVDVMDALGTNIRIDTIGADIMRVVPRVNEEVNEEWLADKGRFAVDGLNRQRLDEPLVKNSSTGRLEKSTWTEALAIVARNMANTPSEKMKAIVGKQSDAESIMSLKDLMAKMNVDNLQVEGIPQAIDADSRSSYIFNSNIVGVEDADTILLVGSNPRLESPVLNARIRRANVAGGTKVASIGPDVDLTYPVENLGNSASVVSSLMDQSHPFFNVLKESERPMIIAGASLFRRSDANGMLAMLHHLANECGAITNDWLGFNVLHYHPGQAAALDLGFRGIERQQPSFVYMMSGDEEVNQVPNDAFVVYQGSHGDAGASYADVVLPGTAYTEKDATYVNTEGRPQRALQAIAPHGNARHDWKVHRALSEVVGGGALPYDDLQSLRQRMVEVAPHFASVDDVEPAVWLNGDAYMHKLPQRSESSAQSNRRKKQEKLQALELEESTPLGTDLAVYYQSDPISRASVTMAKCVAARKREDDKQAQIAKARAAS